MAGGAVDDIDLADMGSAEYTLADFVFEDPFAHLHETNGTLYPDTGIDCEIKAFEARYNAKGEIETLQVGRKRKSNFAADDSRRAAVVLKRYYNKLEELDRTELRIQSPHIRTALREVVKDYPDINLSAQTIVMNGIPKCFFHYRIEIADYARSLVDLVAQSHIQFILLYTYQQLVEPLFLFNMFMDLSTIPTSEAGMDFPNLWMAFRPGELIFMEDDDVPRILLFKSMHLTKTAWRIRAQYIDSDGKHFGHLDRFIYIQSYDNYTPLVRLPVYPLTFHTDPQGISKSVRDRGKKFVSLQGIHYRSYTGLARRPSDPEDEDDEDEDEGFDISAGEKLVKGRIIVDAVGYHSEYSHDHLYFTHTLGSCKNSKISWTDQNFMIFNHKVPAFSLNSRRWWKVNVDDVDQVQFNKDAFDKLILPGGQKDMVHALVNVHTNKLMMFDDVIAGKGTGMVFLLHGESGTGKTLTAESVADFTRRPLYNIGCSDLGFDIQTMETKLTKILRMATEWNAILLLDEADVFLERRSTHDLERNGPVSVFLRVLEYFEGILFLTTNRVSAFDKAVRSRIHMAIRYPKLDHESRRQLWLTFIEKTAEGSDLEWCNGPLLDDLADRELNGRQIKNTVRTAYAMSISLKEDLRSGHLWQALSSLMQFDEVLGPVVADTPADAPTPMEAERFRKRKRFH